jgi:hypothetical protein
MTITDMKIFFKNLLAMLILFVVSIAFVALLDACLDFNIEKSDKIVDVNAAVLIILTFLILCVAWIQLDGIAKISKADFLLRIDDRYGGKDIVEARIIIQEFFCQTYKEGISKEYHIELVANKIQGLRLNINKASDYVILINFIDYLETVAYFCNQNMISEKDVTELVGSSITYYFKVFKPWIDDRRRRYSPDFYCQIEKLVKNLKDKY